MSESVVSGLGPDAPVTTNENGGRQSHLPYRIELLPPRATFAVGKVLKHGAEKYGVDNWHAISTDEHLSHVLSHIFAYLAGDKSDDHLEHAACRAMMALEIQERGGPTAKPIQPSVNPWAAWPDCVSTKDWNDKACKLPPLPPLTPSSFPQFPFESPVPENPIRRGGPPYIGGFPEHPRGPTLQGGESQ